MKVKNIVFSGFAAAILATGGASAAPSIATQGYVDQEVGKVQGSVNTLSTNLTSNYSTATEVQNTIKTSITQAVESDDGAVKEALKGYYTKGEVDKKVEDFLNDDISETLEAYAKTADVNTELNKKQDKLVEGDNISLVAGEDGTVKISATEYGPATDTTAGIVKIGANVNVTADGTISVAAPVAVDEELTEDGTNPVQGKAVYTALSEKASSTALDDLSGTVSGLQSTVTTLVNDKENADNKTTLMDKEGQDDSAAFPTVSAVKTWTESQVSAAIEGAVAEGGAVMTTMIPRPSVGCTSASGRCVLSVDTSGNYTWVDVTAPVDSSDGHGGAGGENM